MIALNACLTAKHAISGEHGTSSDRMPVCTRRRKGTDLSKSGALILFQDYPRMIRVIAISSLQWMPSRNGLS